MGLSQDRFSAFMLLRVWIAPMALQLHAFPPKPSSTLSHWPVSLMMASMGLMAIMGVEQGFDAVKNMLSSLLHIGTMVSSVD
jgi:hypothetical protein